MALKDIAKFTKHNLRTLRHAPLSEISGALGDLGTLLPLMIALALQGSISLSTTLVLSGIFNIATGAAFGLPLPVQPMKAIAAAALASHASQRDTLAAGALVGAAVLILSVTGLLRRLAVWTPVPVVKGIQFGAGLSLVLSAGSGMLGRLGWGPHDPLDNRIWAIAAFLLLILTARATRFPYALLVFTVGLILAIATVATTSGHSHLPGWEIWRPYTISPGFASAEAWSMAVAQLPLTTLNSVIAAAALASDLMGPSFPGSTPTVTELGLSVAAMNLVGCWFGAMPVCHGAGGLAAQHRFGARSGASIILLGSLKLFLGLFLGATLLDLLGSFPRSILGVMVAAAGLELARVGQSLNHGASDLWEDSISANADGDGSRLGRVIKRHRDISDDERQERWAVMLITTAGILAFRNDAVGFVAGVLTHVAYQLSHALERRRDAVSERQPLLRWP
ncbi:hypothetical protein DHEL01_v204084 [Diaporthe helianthi]|uniref:Sulfate transporter n=1 Tax=Diaporthe helianthi TaxID=158607 RepID=A0A2P5I4W6_DIAHE|nr:hypothetical protein DHEL01_v204084 [Diaporthe helianthi]